VIQLQLLLRYERLETNDHRNEHEHAKDCSSDEGNGCLRRGWYDSEMAFRGCRNDWTSIAPWRPRGRYR
jgi:hypothetical protein